MYSFQVITLTKTACNGVCMFIDVLLLVFSLYNDISHEIAARPAEYVTLVETSSFPAGPFPILHVATRFITLHIIMEIRMYTFVWPESYISNV